MSLSDWANIAIIVQGVVIIVSLGFVFYQLRENARLTRAANTQKLVELTSPFALQLMQDRSTAELWVRGAHTWDTMDRVDIERYTNLVSGWLIFYANINYHTRNRADEPTCLATLYSITAMPEIKQRMKIISFFA